MSDKQPEVTEADNKSSDKVWKKVEEWLSVTGAIGKRSGWYYELRSFFIDGDAEVLQAIAQARQEGIEQGRRELSDFEEFDAVKKKLDGYIETNAVITKRFDENYEAYKALKKQLEEKDEKIKQLQDVLFTDGDIKADSLELHFDDVASKRAVENAMMQVKEKNELLEKIRPLLDQGSIVHNTGMMLRFRQDCREALELLNKTMPKKDA